MIYSHGKKGEKVIARDSDWEVFQLHYTLYTNFLTAVCQYGCTASSAQTPGSLAVCLRKHKSTRLALEQGKDMLTVQYLLEVTKPSYRGAGRQEKTGCSRGGLQITGVKAHGNEGMKAQHSSAQLKRWKVMESVPNQNGKTFKQRITRKKETYGKTHQRSVLGLASFPKWDMRTTTSLQDQKRNDLYGECQESSNAPLPSHHVREEKSGSLCFWVDTNAWCQGRREAPGATQMCTLSATHTKALDSGVLVGNANIYRDSCIFMEHSFSDEVQLLWLCS